MNLSIDKKVTLGLLAILIIFLATVILYDMTLINTKDDYHFLLEKVSTIEKLQFEAESQMLQSRRNEKDFILRSQEKYIDRFKKSSTEIKEALEKVNSLSLELKYQEISDKSALAKQFVEKYITKFLQMAVLYKEKGLDHNSGLQGHFRKQVHALAKTIEKDKVLSKTSALEVLLTIRKHEKDYLLREDQKYVKKNLKTLDQLSKLLKKYRKDKNISLVNNYRRSFVSLVKKDAEIKALTSALRKDIHKTEEILSELHKLIIAKVNIIIKDIEGQIESNSIFALIIGVIAIILGVILTIILYKVLAKYLLQIKENQKQNKAISDFQKNEVQKVSNTLKELADGNLATYYQVDKTSAELEETRKNFLVLETNLNESIKSQNLTISNVISAINAINDGSQQISTTGQNLSQGATEQASSIEEISSSMNEIGGQTRKNAENASNAQTFSRDATQNASAGNSKMKDMTKAMDEINSSSENIAKIIKVIDEIAFQTNLLALNAAVEAARAGIHGKGFAVVAEEVRNLAQRSAQAAKETNELIDDSSSKVQLGDKIAKETAESLGSIVDSIEKMSDLINAITIGSKEQEQGVAQIIEALTQLDSVTQINAASAEESASAVKELSFQAEKLNSMVSKFKLATTTEQKD